LQCVAKNAAISQSKAYVITAKSMVFRNGPKVNVGNADASQEFALSGVEVLSTGLRSPKNKFGGKTTGQESGNF